MGKAKKKRAVDFEGSIAKLEAIVERLEDEQIPLEESLKLFAEGKKLAKACQEGLAEAEERVRQLIDDTDGEPAETPLDAESTDDEAENDEDDGGEGSDGKPASRDDIPF